MFDSHAHVSSSQFDVDRDEVYSRALAAGLKGWVEVGTSVLDSRQAVALAEKYEGVVAAVGVHPNDIGDLSEVDFAQMTALLDHRKVKAIGEVGLDFYRGGSLDEQVLVLKRFLSLAVAKNLPVIFHVRSGETLDAHSELLKLLESYAVSERMQGVIHTYSGSVAQAKRYLELGLYISFSGVVTFKNAGELVEVAKMVPVDKMLIETDCPFLTPEPHRGQRNEPVYVKFVAEKLAVIRGESLEAVAAQTWENTKRLFDII